MERAGDPSTAARHINSLQFVLTAVEARMPSATNFFLRNRILDIEEEEHTMLNSVHDDDLPPSESEENTEMTD
jgi:hypothetical protein